MATKSGPPPQKIIFLLIQLIQTAYSTFDMKDSVFQFLASRLSSRDCRKLVAALYSPSYELPEPSATVEYKIPNESCIKLLRKWNTGTEKWEGAQKTHENIAHRLRQMRKNELADWLGKTVFSQLKADIKDALQSFEEKYQETESEMAVAQTTGNPIKSRPTDHWEIYETVLPVLTIVLLIMFLLTLCRLLALLCTTNNEYAKSLESRGLLKESDSEDDVE